jgi:hypothetical protein
VSGCVQTHRHILGAAFERLLDLRPESCGPTDCENFRWGAEDSAVPRGVLAVEILFGAISLGMAIASCL